ncbi:MAG: 50S ribosomal protein L30 [Legionellales bacterium]|nr:50S ribosomal protein L30 [Legionellales bacterium]
MHKTIKITLVKSLIGRIPKHIVIAKQLRLRKINATALHQDNAAIRGMINTISYLVEVEECAK